MTDEDKERIRQQWRTICSENDRLLELLAFRPALQWGRKALISPIMVDLPPLPIEMTEKLRKLRKGKVNDRMKKKAMCADCGWRKEDVEIRRCPLAYELDDKEVMVPLCEACFCERCDDV